MPSIKLLCAGNSHSIILSKDEKLYSCGYNGFEACGLGTDKDMRSFKEISKFLENDEKIVSIHAGIHSLVLTDKGQIYSWGANPEGQCGIGKITQKVSFPTKIRHFKKVLKENETIIQVDVGEFHSIALTNEGRVYVWGSNGADQCGIGNGVIMKTGFCGLSTKVVDLKELKEPLKIELFEEILAGNERITQVCCGGSHTLALSSKGRVYAWGCNDEGQCGIAAKQSFLNTPEPIRYFDKYLEDEETITSLFAGFNQSFALTNKGTAYAWGRNELGQLGLPKTEKQIMFPKKITSLQDLLDDDDETITQISTGRSLSWVLTSKGIVYQFGYDEALGDNGINNDKPIKLSFIDEKVDKEEQEITLLSAGGSHAFALTSKGMVFSWGSNTLAACGLGYALYGKTIEKPTKIKFD